MKFYIFENTSVRKYYFRFFRSYIDGTFYFRIYWKKRVFTNNDNPFGNTLKWIPLPLKTFNVTWLKESYGKKSD